MKRTAVFCFAMACFEYVLAGCGSPAASSEASLDAKVKAMNDIAKEDPGYAAKRAAHGGGRN